MRLIWPLKLLPDQGQRPRHSDRDDEKYGYEHQRLTDVARAIEQDPGHECEPRNQADRCAVDPGVKLVEHGRVVGDKFSAHDLPPQPRNRNSPPDQSPRLSGGFIKYRSIPAARPNPATTISACRRGAGSFQSD